MKQNGNPWALLPLVLFVGLFVGSGVLTGDFYKLPILIAPIIASAFALLFNQKQSLNQKIEWFASGAGHPDIIIMVIIFILAGAFASAAEAMGAVHSTVNLALSIIPQTVYTARAFYHCLFYFCFDGNINGDDCAVTPISAGLSGELGLPTAIAIAPKLSGELCLEIIFLLFRTQPSRQYGHKKHK